MHGLADLRGKLIRFMFIFEDLFTIFVRSNHFHPKSIYIKTQQWFSNKISENSFS